MTIDRCIKKLRKIKEREGNLNFDAIIAKGDELTLGFVGKRPSVKFGSYAKRIINIFRRK